MALKRTGAFIATAALFVSISNIILSNYYSPTLTPQAVTRGKINQPERASGNGSGRERRASTESRVGAIAKSKEVTCHEHGSDCRGYFQYSGPNYSPLSTQILQKEVAMYTYGAENNNDGHLIFFPSETKSGGCIEEWMLADPITWEGRGMSGSGEDRTVFATFFNDESFRDGRDHFYMEIGAHE